MEVRSPWLNSWHDPLSGLKTVTSCVCMADLNGDGDTKLCIGDFDKKLKIYKGTALLIEHMLLDVPIAMCITYRDNSTPRIPIIAVAAGFTVFLYRQLKPYAKWCCPPVEISEVEQDIWNDLTSDAITVSSGTKQLMEARDQGTSLSARASEFLSLDSDAMKLSYIKDSRDIKFTQQTLITCMEVMQKENENPDGIKLLVIGTENKQILILHQDPVDSSYLCRVTLPSQPVLLEVSGVFDNEWKITVSCRDGKMYNIKNGDSRNSAILTGIITDLGSQAVSIARLDKLLWVVTMDKLLSSYSAKGKRMKTMILQDDVTEICTMSLKKSINYSLLLVALATGEVRLYKDSFIVTSFFVERPVIAMRFGSYGREENALIIIHGKGSITVKMWSRHADIDALLTSASKSGPPPEQDTPLPVPKKTKLYIEQTKRECDQASAIHRVFQRDLCKLRLETARAYVKTLTEGRMGVTPIGSQDVRIQVQVMGIGPKFLIKISLQNSGNQPILNSKLLFIYDDELYAIGYSKRSVPVISVPILLPGPKHSVETEVMNIDPQGKAGQVVILMHQSGSSLPKLSVTVKMPLSELTQI